MPKLRRGRANRAGADNNRGLAKAGKSDYDGVIADCDRVITLNPDFAEAYSNRGLAKAIKGGYDGAIADCDRAIALEPNLAEF